MSKKYIKRKCNPRFTGKSMSEMRKDDGLKLKADDAKTTGVFFRWVQYN